MVPIQVRPAVILHSGQFYIVTVQLAGQGHDIVDLIDVLRGQAEIQHHGVFVLFYQLRHFQLLLEGVTLIANQVVSIGISGLEAQLNMVETSLTQRGNTLFGQANA